eukprot:GHVN01026461.1.p1 GENE.GHVN01026461.1~~GHVN01026461.1.p1  ORF type:complete len:140 (+),score=21.83 GHVN01026461.1:346-765(+)
MISSQAARYYTSLSLYIFIAALAAIGFVYFIYAACCRSQHSAPAPIMPAKCISLCLILAGCFTLTAGGGLLAISVVFSDVCVWSQRRLLSEPKGLRQFLDQMTEDQIGDDFVDVMETVRRECEVTRVSEVNVVSKVSWG